jgi:hypothetical protein
MIAQKCKYKLKEGIFICFLDLNLNPGLRNIKSNGEKKFII